mmetsp:Transcript_23747/g.27355  ORF Transcript_23747/g.27355 Transcript_23747/m.27355 type:complete len:193 (+) Transcript_23747:86-664(+)
MDAPKDADYVDADDRKGYPSGSCVNRIFNSIFFGSVAGGTFAAVSAGFSPDPITSSADRLTAARTFVGKTSLAAVGRSIVGPSIWMAAACAAFSFGECTAETMRGKRDSMNAGIGGALCGLVMGSIFRRADLMASSALGMSVVMFSVDYNGPSLEVHPIETSARTVGEVTLPFQESDALKDLRAKYPKYKNH